MIKPDMEIVNWEQGRLVELEKKKKRGGMGGKCQHWWKSKDWDLTFWILYVLRARDWNSVLFLHTGSFWQFLSMNQCMFYISRAYKLNKLLLINSTFYIHHEKPYKKTFISPPHSSPLLVYACLCQQLIGSSWTCSSPNCFLSVLVTRELLKTINQLLTRENCCQCTVIDSSTTAIGSL